MNVAELEPDERIVLLGLVHYLVQADAERSDEEMLEFREIAKELGRKEFDLALREALRRFADLESVFEAALGIARIEARQMIHTIAHDLASVDGIAAVEQEILDRLADLWGLARRV
jgi:hypothetical protein